MKKHSWRTYLCVGIATILISSLVGCGGNNAPDSTSGLKKEEDITESSVIDGPNSSDSSQENSVALNDEIVDFSKSFINQFNGEISGEKESGDLENFISNENLLQFANKMIELTQKQKEQGSSANNYGSNNEFGEIKVQNTKQGIYFVEVPFQYQGSGMTCRLLIKKENQKMEIRDFYFGTMDGIDTIATGHYTEREINDPDIWGNEQWVNEVMKKVIEYEDKLKKKDELFYRCSPQV